MRALVGCRGRRGRYKVARALQVQVPGHTTEAVIGKLVSSLCTAGSCWRVAGAVQTAVSGGGVTVMAVVDVRRRGAR